MKEDQDPRGNLRPLTCQFTNKTANLAVPPGRRMLSGMNAVLLSKVRNVLGATRCCPPLSPEKPSIFHWGTAAVGTSVAGERCSTGLAPCP